MDLEQGSSSYPTKQIRSDTIRAGQLVLLRLPGGYTKSVKLDKDSTVNLGKSGSFYAKELIGETYGLTYEIADKKLKRIPPKIIQEVGDTDATNELINDGQFVQPLTLEEIEALKQSGAHSSEIIKKQIEQHANYALKTEYSKEKYKKRKEAKYSKSFSTIEPTLFNVSEYWFSKDQNRLRDVRADALSQVLNAASVQPGGKYIVVDEASGTIIAGLLERLGGSGRIFSICDIESAPTYPVVSHMNFNSEIVTPVLVSLNWATAQEEYAPLTESTDPSPVDLRSDRYKMRINKRKAASDLLEARREELFAGEFDGLIVSSQYDPSSIVDMLFPYLAGSASIVIHSPFVQTLVDLLYKMRHLGKYLSPSINEAWLRRYQVLPGRTHPMMNMSGSGGFILHAYKVFDNPNAHAITSHRQKKPKLTDAAAGRDSTASEDRSMPPDPGSLVDVANVKGTSTPVDESLLD